jgi:putative hydrolase of the HAD superfamily
MKTGRENRALLFDWGDTLMRVYPEYQGPMYAWPRVAALPGVVETLEGLRRRWRLALATNAVDSDRAEIWRALKRVGLDACLEQVYCFQEVGFKKPSEAFFAHILADLDLAPGRVVMVGDDFENDVLGANQAGLFGVWLNDQGEKRRESDMHTTIHIFMELPAAVEAIDRRYFYG